jgi:hypothetical protein
VPKALIRTFRPSDRSPPCQEACVAQRHSSRHRAARGRSPSKTDRSPVSGTRTLAPPVHRSSLPASLLLVLAWTRCRAEEVQTHWCPGWPVFLQRTDVWPPYSPFSPARSGAVPSPAPDRSHLLLRVSLGCLDPGTGEASWATGAAKPSADSDHTAPLWPSAPHNDWVLDPSTCGVVTLTCRRHVFGAGRRLGHGARPAPLGVTAFGPPLPGLAWPRRTRSLAPHAREHAAPARVRFDTHYRLAARATAAAP